MDVLTLLSLDRDRGRQLSVMPDPEMLGVVEDMARRLLTEEEVAAVMKTCRRVNSRAHDH